MEVAEDENCIAAEEAATKDDEVVVVGRLEGHADRIEIDEAVADDGDFRVEGRDDERSYVHLHRDRAKESWVDHDE